jgi:hypothetical protein
VETSIQDCMKIISEARERTPNDPSPPFKEKEKGGEGRSMLGGQWKVPSLVTNGRFQVWWPMEGSKLGGQWNVPSLVANGMFQVWWPMESSMFGGQWNVKEKHLFTSSISPPTTFTQTFNFFL